MEMVMEMVMQVVTEMGMVMEVVTEMGMVMVTVMEMVMGTRREEKRRKRRSKRRRKRNRSNWGGVGTRSSMMATRTGPRAIPCVAGPQCMPRGQTRRVPRKKPPNGWWNGWRWRRSAGLTKTSSTAGNWCRR